MIDAPLSSEQRFVAEEIAEFITAKHVDKPWITIHGLAGVGKSFLMGHVAHEHAILHPRLGAPTGKAASNLARKFGLHVSTIHQIIYSFNGKYLDERHREKLSFSLKIGDGDFDGVIIMIDECSMCGQRMANDLVNTGARIVAFGDPGQLKPVDDSQFFTGHDYMLTEIRRQAWDSAIIRQAYAVRNRMQYQPDGEDFQVSAFISHEQIVQADMILCWRNNTRRSLNGLKRAHLGIDGPLRQGEPVMCLKNDHEAAVMNGGVYELVAYDYRRHDITVINDRGEVVTIEDVWFEDLDDVNKPLDNSIGFSFAYAATVHKAQGSEFDSVIVADEYTNAHDRDRWLYTAITRAKQKILMHRNW